MVLLDTHAWAWSLIKPHLLSEPARAAINSGPTLISPVSIFEIAQKVRIGRWPEMAPVVQTLPALVHEQGSLLAPLTLEICLDAGLADWPNRDPFDRILGATARLMGVPLVTRDAVFAEAGVACVW